MKKFGLLLLILFFSATFAQEFEVVPDTVGIGLQKNYDIVDFESSGLERCVLYNLGNPWSTNLTGWLEVSGDLEQFFVRNNPETVFVPSGIFRYNNSCCLLPIEICFEFPYVLDRTAFTGRIYSAFTKSGQTGPSGTGSSTGSSVAYSLTVNIDPPGLIEVNGGTRKCIDFYNHGVECFSAPLIVLSDRTVEQIVGDTTLTILYKNNLLAVVLIAAAVVLVLFNTGFFKSIFRKTLGRLDIKIALKK